MLTRRILLGDAPLPDCAELVRRGRERARAVQVVPSLLRLLGDPA